MIGLVAWCLFYLIASPHCVHKSLSHSLGHIRVLIVTPFFARSTDCAITLRVRLAHSAKIHRGSLRAIELGRSTLMAPDQASTPEATVPGPALRIKPLGGSTLEVPIVCLGTVSA
jgi:hypothetical protein